MTILTRQQVKDIAMSAEKTSIFSADYQKTERRQAERILDLCSTIVGLRELLTEAMGGYTACTPSVYSDLCECSFCTLARRVKEAQR